ncbi:hypothetical protein BDV93DRAFT_194997 [Ceratobasidium sp. AG-I]|nr:hypothetical protein BDV93DRAFT_194997 [Ceratobasidium sp. AG-I]
MSLIYILSQARFEIIQYLTPQDLLSLERTCRHCWRLLSGCEDVWRRTLQNCPAIPACPTERRYRTWAQLYCTTECSVCGDETQNPICTLLKARLCDCCEMTELVASPGQVPRRRYNQETLVIEQVVLRLDLERIERRGTAALHNERPNHSVSNIGNF